MRPEQIQLVIDREPGVISSADFFEHFENNRLLLEAFRVGYVDDVGEPGRHDDDGGAPGADPVQGRQGCLDRPGRPADG